jgi:uncharacterized protein (DUF433 family)
MNSGFRGIRPRRNAPDLSIIVAEFPDVTRDQIAACLDYARELAEFEAVV